MTEGNTAYDKYCKENDEQWEKEKQIKVTILNYNMIPYFYGILLPFICPKLQELRNLIRQSNKKY